MGCCAERGSMPLMEGANRLARVYADRNQQEHRDKPEERRGGLPLDHGPTLQDERANCKTAGRGMSDKLGRDRLLASAAVHR